MITFSANTQESLRQQVLNSTIYLEKHPSRVNDMAYTLNQRREHRTFRTFCTAGDDGVMGDPAAISKVPKTRPDLVMVFSGQGAQWPTMGRDLILTDPEFRCDIREIDDILQSLQYPPTWSIEG